MAGTELDSIIVPDLDTDGNRIWCWKSFFDRSLRSLSSCPCIIAVCHSGQLVDAVPVDEFDIKVDCIVVSGNDAVNTLVNKAKEEWNCLLC